MQLEAVLDPIERVLLINARTQMNIVPKRRKPEMPAASVSYLRGYAGRADTEAGR